MLKVVIRHRGISYIRAIVCHSSKKLGRCKNLGTGDRYCGLPAPPPPPCPSFLEANASSVNSGGTTTINPTGRAVSAPPGPSSAGAGAAPEKKSPAKLQKQRSFIVTTVYTPPASRSKALQKMRAKNRAAKAFKSNLSVRAPHPLPPTHPSAVRRNLSAGQALHLPTPTPVKTV